MANITTQTIRVDLSTGKVIPTAYTHQMDTARTLVFDMYNGGLPYTMTGNTVKFAYKSPIVDGQYTVIAGSSMASGTVSGNKVTVALPVAYTSISGVGLLTMIITPSSGTIRPVNIRLVVQKSADGADEIAGASDFPATLEEIAEDWLEENTSATVDQFVAEISSDFFDKSDPSMKVWSEYLYRLSSVISADTTTSAKMFRYTTNAMSVSDISDALCHKVIVSDDVLAYFVSTRAKANSDGYALVTYMNSSDEAIGYEFMIPGTNTNLTIAQQILSVPNDASYFYINSRSYDAVIYATYKSKVYDTAKKLGTVTSTLPVEVSPMETVAETSLYRFQTDAIVDSLTNSTVRKVIINPTVLAYVVTTKINTNASGYALINYFDSSDNLIGTEYVNKASSTISIVNQALNIPEDAAYFYVNSRNITPEIYVIRSTSATDTKAEIASGFAGMYLYKYAQIVTPTAVTADYLYRYQTNANTINTVSGGKITKVAIDSDMLCYYITNKVKVGGTGYTVVSYFDSDNNQLGYQFPLAVSTTTTHTHQILTIPDGTAYFLLNSRDYTPVIEAVEKNALEETSEEKHSISILFVGNSLTQDGISYLPYLLKTYYPEVDFKLYMWYNSGYKMSQQYADFNSNAPCDIFSVAENSPTWTNYEDTVTMASVCSTYSFDVVCLQEYFNYQSISDATDWENCKSYIASHYTGGNGLEFISLFHAPKRDVADTVFTRTKAGNALILQSTIAQDMVPVGIAVYRALSTDLIYLGGSDCLSPDGTHTQEGLPCLLQTWCALCWLFDKLSINKSVYGHPFRMTTEIFNLINVPGANLGNESVTQGVITGTDAENILAQEIAIKAYKEGKQFVANNISANNT